MSRNEKLVDRVEKLEAMSREFLWCIGKASFLCDRMVARPANWECIPAPGCWGTVVGLGKAKWEAISLRKPAVAIGYKGLFVIVAGQSLEWEDSGMSTGWRCVRAVLLNLPETTQEADGEFKAWEVGMDEVRCSKMLVAPSCAWLLQETVELAAGQIGK